MEYSLEKGIKVASHNIMRGFWLDKLIEYYKKLKADDHLAVLCIQENVTEKGIAHVERISEELGNGYRSYYIEEFPSTAIMHDSSMLERIETFSIKLPKLKKYSWFVKLMSMEEAPLQRYAIATRLQAPGGEPFTVVNMHLTAWGGNKIRYAQLNAIQKELKRRGISERIIMCGDTNLFAWTKMMQRKVLDSTLEMLKVQNPLKHEPTYYFSRIYKKARWAFRVPHYLGKIGIDLPRHYDFVVSEMPYLNYGKVTTPESDHDLVWAKYDIS
ncbi:MAG: hypothetical protein R3251_02870 [Candidatus Spechtbacterales bacterium]|nr:hypothetical protein [Candidatus Spechtbacterales bacterium]